MTTFYLDTEFNGHGGELISMALLRNSWDGWYGVTKITSDYDPWVAENVVPKLGQVPLEHDVFRASFVDWISKFTNPEIICDCHVDAMHFSQMFSGKDYASSLDFPYRITVLKTPPGHPVSKNPHNAVDDAFALMMWHQNESL